MNSLQVVAAVVCFAAVGWACWLPVRALLQYWREREPRPRQPRTAAGTPPLLLGRLNFGYLPPTVAHALRAWQLEEEVETRLAMSAAPPPSGDLVAGVDNLLAVLGVSASPSAAADFAAHLELIGGTPTAEPVQTLVDLGEGTGPQTTSTPGWEMIPTSDLPMYSSVMPVYSFMSASDSAPFTASAEFRTMDRLPDWVLRALLDNLSTLTFAPLAERGMFSTKLPGEVKIRVSREIRDRLAELVHDRNPLNHTPPTLRRLRLRQGQSADSTNER